jgi:hypothetical protein
MLGPAQFEMVETVGRDALRRHPVWSRFDDVRDRPRILAWGVAPERLEREARRFQSCGALPLFPVLELEPLPPERDLLVAARFRTAGGSELEGWVLAPEAFGVFVGEREFPFNRGLAGPAGRTAERLARALSAPVAGVFPLDYTTGLHRAGGEALAGRIEVYW